MEIENDLTIKDFFTQSGSYLKYIASIPKNSNNLHTIDSILKHSYHLNRKDFLKE